MAPLFSCFCEIRRDFYDLGAIWRSELEFATDYRL